MDYLSAQQNYNMLSIKDLLAARDLYHGFLISKPDVVGTAIGRYLIRKTDPPPPVHEDERAPAMPAEHKKPRTLANSEVRRYSWPCILVFVDKWVNPEDFRRGKADPFNVIPKALQLPDGGQVPVCTVLAEPMPSRPGGQVRSAITGRLFGGGYPLLAEAQGEQHIASVGCLVTDAHTVYLLTNRHVTGPAGTPVYALVGGRQMEIGRSSRLQLSREPFEKVWWPHIGREVYSNLDIGLVEIDDLSCWTAQVYGIGQMGRLADVSSGNLSLRLIGCPVHAYGGMSGIMEGNIFGLFYRYKQVRGFEYVADFLIGPRAEGPFMTQHGDSGTVWMLDTHDPDDKNRPIAVQWGGVAFQGDGEGGTAYALATSLSTVCDMLNVDLVQDLNAGLPTYWGSVGHYTIATKACDVIGNANLRTLMQANRDRVTYTSNDIRDELPDPKWQDTFVPLADVADVVWKAPMQGSSPYSRPDEHPNHFADMDKPRPSDGKTLLQLCQEDENNVSVPVWLDYNQAIGNADPGLLPFRVWQIYEEMVKALKQQPVDVARFVAAAGVLAHYVGDACQPLHISYMFNGDPDRPGSGNKPYGYGVHSDYETHMVNRHIFEIIDGLNGQLPGPVQQATIQGGQQAAIATVGLMQETFDTIAPVDIVNTYAQLKAQFYRHHGAVDSVLDGLWDQFSGRTLTVMENGCLALAKLWESAWAEGNGDNAIPAGQLVAIDFGALVALYQDKNFVPSHTMADIGPVLQ